MLFQFLRFWVTIAMRGWFKRVYVDFSGSIPADAPVIFACTHPNSAIDFVFVPLITQKPVSVLVRGDVFENKFLNRIFRKIYMLPIYRFRDGYASLGKNEQSFNECFKHFDKNGRILIFSEGVCVQEKQLQPLRKGTARLALDYIHKHGGSKVYIVPVATNYTRFRTFRSSVMVNFGTPIATSDYSMLYEENANKAYEKLTQDIASELDRNFVSIKNYSDHCDAEYALMAQRMTRTEQRKKWMINDRAVFEQEKEFIAAYPRTEKTMSEELKARMDNTTEGVLTSKSPAWVHLIKVVLLTPFIVAAAALLAIPYGVARWIVRTKIKDIIFDNTVTIMGTAVVGILSWHIWLLGSLLTSGLSGVRAPLIGLMLVLIGIELIDDFWHSLNVLRHRTRIDKLRAAYSDFGN